MAATSQYRRTPKKERSLTHSRKTKAAAMFSQSRRAVSNAYFVRVKSSAT